MCSPACRSLLFVFVQLAVPGGALARSATTASDNGLETLCAAPRGEI